MTPILYPANETEFKTNGLGRLSDAIDCKVTEERNGSYELAMKYPIDGIHYSDIENGRLIYAQPSQGAEPEPFEIYLITRPLNGQVEIKAEHISYRMKYIPVKAFTANDVKSALQGLKNNAVCSCPFSFETDKTAGGEFKVESPDSMRSFLADGDNTITGIYSGEWEFKRFKAILHLARGSDNGVTIRYGKNLTSLEQEENIEEMYSGIYPYFKVSEDVETSTTTTDPSTSRETTSTSTESVDRIVELPEKILKTKVADQFPYYRVVAVDLSDKLNDGEQTRNWTEQEVDPATSRIKTVEKSETIKGDSSPDSLRRFAEAYIRDNGLDTPKVSLKVEFVDLWKSADYENMAAIEKVHLCDIVRVEFIRLGVSATAEVTKTEWDVLNERYSSIDIGEAKATLNDIVRSNVSRATAQISTDISSMRQDIKPKPIGQTHTGTKQVTLNDAVTTSLFTKKEMATILGIEEDSVNNADTTVTAENKDETIKTAITGINYSANGWAVVFADKVTGTVTVGYTIKHLGG